MEGQAAETGDSGSKDDSTKRHTYALIRVSIYIFKSSLKSEIKEENNLLSRTATCKTK